MAKVGVMVVSGLLGIFTSRMILSHWSVEEYAQYGLIASLPSLLPFADLGIAAVVINAVAGSSDPKHDERVFKALTSCFRVLVCSGLVIIVVAIVIQLAGWWPVLLGDGLKEGGGELTATIGLVVFALALPMSIGSRVLVGMDRTATQIVSQSVSAPFLFLAVGACALLALPVGDYLAVFAYLGTALASGVALILAWRALAPQLGNAVKAVPFPGRIPGVKVFDLAWPMLVQIVALPIALQTDRVLLSHLAEPEDLAQYNLSAQFFSIALQTIAAAGVALWPVFARARATGTMRSPTVPVVWFFAAGLAISTVLWIVSPWLAQFVSGGQVVLDTALLTWFGVFVVLQAVKYPLGMYMTDLAGLRFQVLPTVLMIPVSIGLSLWLIPAMGAAGAIAGSAAAVAVLQVLPSFIYVRWDLGRRRRAAVSVPE